MSFSRRTLVVLALMVGAGLPMLARGNAVTVRLNIAGGRLATSIAVTERRLLELSNVYAGAFLGPVTNAIDSSWDRYTVVFVVESRTYAPELALTGVQKPYTLYYARNPDNGEGYVYLPAHGEDGYQRNVNLIIRTGHDGRWHYAAAEWAELLNSHLR